MKTNFTNIFFIFCITLFFLHQYPLCTSNNTSSTKKAIVIGASAGIGKALAKILSKNGYQVGLVARRTELLKNIQKELLTPSFIKSIDISKTETAITLLKELITEMGNIDLIILNSGIGCANKDLDWQKQQETIDVNVSGFTALATVAITHFLKQKKGHLVGISSIAALRGLPHSYTYAATKAYISTFLEGVRNSMRMQNVPIYVTDIKPGFVDTDMVKNNQKKFWESSPEQAAQQIYDAIGAKKEHAYVTKRWRLVAWFLKCAPDWLFDLVWK